MANATSKFRVGDRVINKYNQHGTVTGRSDEFVRVQVDGLQYDGGWYESSLRFETPAHAPAPAPVNPESKLGFTVGQRVEILNKGYTGGRYGVVTGFKPTLGMYGTSGSIAFVEVTTDKGFVGGWLPDSIKLVAPVAPTGFPGLGSPALTPNQQEVLPQSKSQATRLGTQTGTQLKYAGQNAAISKNSQVYQLAKNIAIQFGKDKKLVNIDMVQGELLKYGYKAADLGNAAGAIFRGKNWKDTGNTYLSRRESNHARRITVWAYVGA